MRDVPGAQNVTARGSLKISNEELGPAEIYAIASAMSGPIRTLTRYLSEFGAYDTPWPERNQLTPR